MVARNEGVLMAQRTTTNQEKGEKFPEKMLKKKKQWVSELKNDHTSSDDASLTTPR